MAFHSYKALLLFLLIAATISDARIDLLKASKPAQSESKLGWTDCCRNCIDDAGKFYCIDIKEGTCPETCSDCYCPSKDPLRCSCFDAIDKCPSKCAKLNENDHQFFFDASLLTLNPPQL